MNKKQLLYKSDVEYSDYAINHILGCSHDCRFPCYAKSMFMRFKLISSNEKWLNPQKVDNAEEILKKELKKLKHKIKWVHFSFFTDPFMFNRDDLIDYSLKLIKIVNDENIKVTTLTKGVLPEELKNFNKLNEYGITLVSLNEEFRAKFEPNSSVFEERIKSLRVLSESGCKTWVSIEPYPTPNIIEQDLTELLDSIKFVNKIVFGKWNYNKLIKEFKGNVEFYKKCCETVKEFCDKNNIELIIKRGTNE